MSTQVFRSMIGVVMERLVKSDEELRFFARDGREFRFYHSQQCCERVRIEDIEGNLTDLVGSPLLMAEGVSSQDEPAPEDVWAESRTWTFYKFSTVKGSVTVRWLGTSNGYYSERVSFEISPAKHSVPAVSETVTAATLDTLKAKFGKQ